MLVTTRQSQRVAEESHEPVLCVLDMLHQGPRPYGEVHALQQRLVADRAQGRGCDHLLLLEHQPVVTLGRGATRVGTSPEAVVLDTGRYPVVEVERGGEATWHGPGQLVGYPILALRDHERDIHGVLRRLEDVIIASLAEVGVADVARRPGDTGVWTQDGGRKLASIGIAVSRWVTWHGFAINVTPDLDAFAAIRPCGFDATVMTSVARELAAESRPVPSLSDLAAIVSRRFAAVFERTLRPASPGDDATLDRVQGASS